MTHAKSGPEDHQIAVEIFRIQPALEAQGFTVYRQLQQPVWMVYRCQSHQVYQLSFQTLPKAGWVIHPIDESPTREQIIGIIQSVLDPSRVACLEISMLPPNCHPWTLVLLREKMQRHVVARFRNRQDADDQLRAIRRYMPKAKFEVVFDATEVSIGP